MFLFKKHKNDFCFFDPKHGFLDPKNLSNVYKQHRNWAKIDQFCFKRFGNRFGGTEGAAPFKAYFVCSIFCTFFKSFGKNSRISSTGLETGCKPVLLFICTDILFMILLQNYNRWCPFEVEKLKQVSVGLRSCQS